MSLAVRIIPCLDVIRDGRVVKGINFKDIVDAEISDARYDTEGADEICIFGYRCIF